MATQTRLFFVALCLFAATLVPQLAVAQQFTSKAKLVGTGSPLPAQRGYSVAVSGDGNTALVGGLDNSAWVFTPGSGGIWIQQAQLSVPNTSQRDI